jgi:hypothetical protein
MAGHIFYLPDGDETLIFTNNTVVVESGTLKAGGIMAGLIGLTKNPPSRCTGIREYESWLQSKPYLEKVQERIPGKGQLSAACPWV